MTPEELRDELTMAGVVCRVQKEEVIAETCYFCGNTRWNLEMNAGGGFFHCWVCDEGGRLDKLLRDWLKLNIFIPIHRSGPRTTTISAKLAKGFAAVPAYTMPSAAQYLAKRGIDRITSQMYELMVCTDKQHLLASRLIIPATDYWSGGLVGHIGRTYTNQYPKYLSTMPHRVVVGYRIRSTKVACILVEGAFDGIAVHRAGYHAAVLLGTTTPRVQEFASRLHQATPIVIMLDGAAAKEADRLRWTLQTVHPVGVHIALLPVHMDPADLHPKALRRFIDQAVARNQ